MKSLTEEFHRVHGKARSILGTCLYGLAASIAAVGFELAISRLYAHAFQKPAAEGTGRFLLISLGVIIVASLVTGWLLNSFAPKAAGSGIPQVKAGRNSVTEPKTIH